MKIALIENETLEEKDSLLRQLRNDFSADDPIYIFCNRKSGYESHECQFPLYLSRPFYKYQHLNLGLEKAAILIQSLIKKYSYDKVFIYGAGTHTEMLCDVWNKLDGEIPIDSVIVSGDSDSHFLGYPVVNVEKLILDKTKNNIVVYSSLSYEFEMFKTFNKYHKGIDSVGIYNYSNANLSEPAKSDYLNHFINPNISKSSELLRWIDVIKPDTLLCFQSDFNKYLHGKISEQYPVTFIEGNYLTKLNKQFNELVNRKRQPKLLYVDQSQRNEIGHYYHYGKYVLSSARNEYVTYLACNQVLDIEITHSDYVFPIFRFDIWGRDLLTQETPVRETSAGDFVERLNSLVTGLKLSDEDVIFIPNISDYELVELANKLDRIMDSGASLKLFIRYGLDERIDRISIIRDISSRYDKVDFYTDTIEMSKLHSHLSGVEMTVLPIPVVQKTEDITVKSNINDRITISYLGDARAEKGFHYLPNLIRKFYEHQPQSQYIFEIHNYTNGYDPIVSKAMSELEKISENYPIKLNSSSLSNKDYNDFLQRSDVLLCLYDPEVYQYRSSHIATEALAYGKELLMLKGSSPANQLGDDCPWVADNESEIIEQLMWIVNNRYDSQKFATDAQHFFKFQSTGNYLVQKLME